jgi:hypothetical protein
LCVGADLKKEQPDQIINDANERSFRKSISGFFIQRSRSKTQTAYGVPSGILLQVGMGRRPAGFHGGAFYRRIVFVQLSGLHHQRKSVQLVSKKDPEISLISSFFPTFYPYRSDTVHAPNLKPHERLLQEIRPNDTAHPV